MNAPKTSRRVLALTVLSIMGLPFSAFADDPLILEFQEDRALISGFAPGSEIAVFVASWSDSSQAPSLRPHADILTDSNFDGVVELQSDEGHLAFATMVVAGDMGTGALAYGRPGPRPIRILNVAAHANRDGGEEDIIISNALIVQILLMRPDVGFWHAVIHDGSDLDADGLPNQSITIDVEDLYPVGRSSAPPRDPEPDDLLLIVDPYTFGIQVIEVG